MFQSVRTILSIAGLITALSISTTSQAGVLPLDDRLDAWGDYGTKTIDFTDVQVLYGDVSSVSRGWNRGKNRSRSSNIIFVASSTRASTFSLDSFVDGYNDVNFSGFMSINAKFNSDGSVRTGSSFSIYSTDNMFTGDDNRRFNLVYGGDLLAFGWSGTEGILEFDIGNLEGWAMDEWQAGEEFGSRQEHIMMTLDAFDLNDKNAFGLFSATADGFAVVPVPAAVWLFGTGLLALVGVARRKI